MPGREDRIANLLDARDFDYVIGSVHFVGDRAVDDADWDIWEGGGDPDAVWRRYFETLAEAARSGLFDILAHPDLVKVWGRARPLPERDPRFYYEPAVEAIAEAGVAVEVSTAGLRKPVGELYPAPAFAAMCVDAGAAFSPLLGRPRARGHRRTGTNRRSRRWTNGASSEIAVFDGRERRLESLGRSEVAARGLAGMSVQVGIGYDVHPFEAGPAAGSRRRRDRARARARWPLRRRRADPCGHRRDPRARPAWATWGRSSRPRRSNGATPTRSIC